MEIILFSLAATSLVILELWLVLLSFYLLLELGSILGILVFALAIFILFLVLSAALSSE